jgi:hypothetical protein
VSRTGEFQVSVNNVNHGHLAAAVIAADGNVLGAPATIPFGLAGLPSATRDGHLRAAISALIATAKARGARAIVIEDLNFAEARAERRERHGRRPSHGRRYRAMVSPACRPAGSGTGWSRWPPTRVWRSSPSTRLTPPVGEPSTGCGPCGSTTPRRPVTTRQRW